jgi:hypothetical protein
MSGKYLRTSELARAAGLPPNTVRRSWTEDAEWIQSALIVVQRAQEGWLITEYAEER